MKIKASTGVSLLLAIFVLASSARARDAVFVTADNLDGTNLFGTLDLKTGKFTQIAQTTPLFYGLTTGADGRLYGADIDTGTLFTISDTGVTTPYGSITAPGYQYINEGAFGFLGLAYRSRADDFLAVNVDPMHVSLYAVSHHGNKQKDLGVIEGPDTGVFFSGSLTYGPRGKLYFDFVASGVVAQLYTLDESTGAPTPVGSGLNSDILTLFSDGNELYGIDTDSSTQIGIYIINRKTGVAEPTGVSVTGLPSTDDFYIDTATVAPLAHARCD